MLFFQRSQYPEIFQRWQSGIISQMTICDMAEQLALGEKELNAIVSHLGLLFLIFIKLLLIRNQKYRCVLYVILSKSHNCTA